MLKTKLDLLFGNDQVVKEWKAGQWLNVQQWMDNFDTNLICQYGRKLPFLIQLEVEDKRH